MTGAELSAEERRGEDPRRARADGMSAGVSTCRHCGERIVLVNWALGPGWTHQPQGAAFMDGAHDLCARTVAEPVDGGAS